MTGRRETDRQRIVRALEEAGLSLGAALGLPVGRLGEFQWNAVLSPDRTELRVFEDTSATTGSKPPSLKRLLNSFIGIRSPEDVESFVRSWGPLCLCRTHGVRRCTACPAGGYQLDMERLEEDEGFVFIEPVAGYLFHSRLARVVLRLIAETHRGELSREDPDADLLEWAMQAAAVSDAYYSVGAALRISRFASCPD